MDSLFSHAPNSDESHSRLDNASKHREQRFEVRVPVETDQAFEGFTDYPHLWWPSEFTAFGSGTHVSIEDDEVGEEGGEEAQWLAWARIADFQPSHALAFDWLNGPESRINIQFEPTGPSTSKVVVNVTGATLLKRVEDGTFKEVDWERVLGFYARFMGAELPAQLVEEGM